MKEAQKQLELVAAFLSEQTILSLATTGEVAAVDGTVVALRCDTLCVHGDTPGAVAIAAAVRRALAEAGVAVAPFAADRAR